ncbi:MAG: hypothetical protein WA718_02165 [Terriglobales bacterium]
MTTIMKLMDWPPPQLDAVFLTASLKRFRVKLASIEAKDKTMLLVAARCSPSAPSSVV